MEHVFVPLGCRAHDCAAPRLSTSYGVPLSFFEHTALLDELLYLRLQRAHDGTKGDCSEAVGQRRQSWKTPGFHCGNLARAIGRVGPLGNVGHLTVFDGIACGVDAEVLAGERGSEAYMPIYGAGSGRSTKNVVELWK